MAYDTPQRERYYQPSAAFGATTDSRLIIGPKGKKGFVVDMGATITAAMVGTTSVPEMVVGTGGSDATYARYRLGTTAIAGYGTGARRASQDGGNTLDDGTPSFEDYVGHVLMRRAAIPADTPITISRVQGVGGVPAGTAETWVDIEWV